MAYSGFTPLSLRSRSFSLRAFHRASKQSAISSHTLSQIKHSQLLKALILFAAIFLLLPFDAFGQSGWRRAAVADSLHQSYRFAEAVDTLQAALAAESDSICIEKLQEAMLLSGNALAMTDYCSRPTVITKQRFSLKDFFLFYPLEEGAWRMSPNPLDSLGREDFAEAVFIPKDAVSIYYSARSEDGSRNIYHTALKDSLWSIPELPDEALTSSSDEIYPMLSPDGKALYFASKGLYGIGGYDLYVSRLDPQTLTWGEPENLGFPYSSPKDDFLLINTPDGKYTIFASNRECSSDSVYIYVLEYDSMPVRSSIKDPAALRDLVSLVPSGDPSRMDVGDTFTDSESSEGADVRLYRSKMARVRALRDSVYAGGKKLDDARGRWSAASDEERPAIAAEILSKETLLSVLQDSLSAASRALQKVEMEFLLNGIAIDRNKIQMEADREVVGASEAYTFTRHDFGPAPLFQFEKPKKSFDYSFMILPEGRFAEDDSLPDGIVYQIQITTGSRKSKVSELRGLSPVYERHNPSTGKYTCYAGVFRTYKDVMDKLNTVKKLGFKSAIIAAFEDGKSISVKTARERESVTLALYMVSFEATAAFVVEHQDLISRFGGDLSKSDVQGHTVYKVGPFSSESIAQSLLEALEDAGAESVSVEKQLID